MNTCLECIHYIPVLNNYVKPLFLYPVRTYTYIPPLNQFVIYVKNNVLQFCIKFIYLLAAWFPEPMGFALKKYTTQI